ncbi:MAG: hypothetical protein CSA75_00275, partial [Sorangium cellulosum]
MSEIVSNARSARESLAKGLNLLQANPNAPPDYLAAAEPIAEAMGALHRIESGGADALKPCADQALASVRNALSILQAKAASDPQIMQTMEAVASSLGMVFGLTKMGEHAQGEQAPAAQPAQPQPGVQGTSPAPTEVQQPPAQQPQQYAPPPQPNNRQPNNRQPN